MSKQSIAVIARIRGHMVALGYPVDSLTDEELERGILEAGKTIAKAGVTVKEAGESLMVMHTARGLTLR